MITLQQRGRFGNLLSQYAFARTLTDRWGYALEANRISGFPGTAAVVDGERVVSPRVAWACQWPTDGYSARRIEARELLEPPNAHVTLHGWFQRFELISQRADDIRKDWLRLEDALPERSSGEFLICLRLGDYVVEKADKEKLDTFAHSTLTVEEVRRLVRTVPHSRLHFVTDEPAHAIFTALRDLGGTVHSGKAMEDFRLIHSFQKVAICQSTFHWWPTFLGRAREIYFPPLNRGIWSKPGRVCAMNAPVHYGIDLRVPGDGRYIYDW